MIIKSKYNIFDIVWDSDAYISGIIIGTTAEGGYRVLWNNEAEGVIDGEQEEIQVVGRLNLSDYDQKSIASLTSEQLQQRVRNQYRVSPVCPHCQEEHCGYVVNLTKEEETRLGEYYKGKENLSTLALGLEEMANPPLIITRKFRCEACGEEFEKSVVVLKSNKI